MREMDSKDDIALVKNTPDHDAVPAATSVEEMEEAAPAPDYTHFTKKDFVDLIKDLARQDDFRKVDSTIKEIKLHFDEIQDHERSEALKRFVEEGGSPKDFEFRPDPLDISFEAIYKVVRDRKTEHFKVLEEQKNENFKNKNTLLEELRTLVDGEDDRRSFDKVKDIQQKWRAIGPVPAAHVRPQWASYHALMDRFYDNRNIYFELKELDRKKNLEAKLELCARAEKLASVERLGDAVRELNELHEEYKHIGPVARDEKDAVWERFKKASDAVYARRDELAAKIQKDLVENLQQKEKIIEEVTAFASFQSDRIKEWNQKTTEIIALQKKWEAIGAVPRAKSKDINKKFWAGFKTFFNVKGTFFKKLDEARTQNLELKRGLIQQAEALKASSDWDKTANELKLLQQKWKDIGPVPEKLRDKVFLEFKAACDYFFDQRRVKFEEADKQQADNLAKKEAICVELEQMIEGKTGTLAQLREMQRSFHAIGFVPKQAVVSIRNRFNTAMDKFLAGLQVSQSEKDSAMLEIQLENLKTDPDAGHKIQQREQGLRKKIQKAENDLAILKNNLEFFGRSKNAEKMKAEFNEKIEAGAAEVQQLKSQLKQLRAAL
jgi:hypothetical protein